MKRHLGSAIVLVFLSGLAISLLCRDRGEHPEFLLSDLEGPAKVLNPDLQVSSAFARHIVWMNR